MSSNNAPPDRPATLHDVTEAEERITAAIAAAEERAAERSRDMQTEILKGLGAFARGNFARFHSVESNQTDLNTRVAAIEERLMDLETRRPPHWTSNHSAASPPTLKNGQKNACRNPHQRTNQNNNPNEAMVIGTQTIRNRKLNYRSAAPAAI
jgi:hypothetical protein